MEEGEGERDGGRGRGPLRRNDEGKGKDQVRFAFTQSYKKRCQKKKRKFRPSNRRGNPLLYWNI